ncbi:hypothetical protein D5S17_26975 [Pseudonocardiaceae bacterium YIM PH 21723]|nr:hypothetical protein D5S17_26975 [Pseudonocardiaceae bacterium YIM PH 21723]
MTFPQTVQAPPQQQQPLWHQRASARTGFGNLVLVEFRKLFGTLSDRLTLLLAPVMLIGVMYLFSRTGKMESAAKQMFPLLISIQFGLLLTFVAVIKLVAGEWHYKSAQPTLLMQPSRMRYLSAQTVVVLSVWLVSALLTFLIYPVFIRMQADRERFGFLLDIRPGWVLGVTLAGTALVLISALIVAMHLPNPTAALVVFFVVVPLLMVARSAAPAVFGVIYPLEPAYLLAGQPDAGTVQAIVSGLLWLSLLVWGAIRIQRRDAG